MITDTGFQSIYYRWCLQALLANPSTKIYIPYSKEISLPQILLALAVSVYSLLNIIVRMLAISAKDQSLANSYIVVARYIN